LEHHVQTVNCIQHGCVLCGRAVRF